MKKFIFFFLALLLTLSINIYAEKKSEAKDTLLTSSILSGMKLRLIGPGVISGRIGDIAVNHLDKSTFYVAVASGGVWKTTNNGTSFTPIFDSQSSYSIGCVALDPNNPYIVWIGTGENNSQRSVAYGDGVYKSIDGGKSWNRVGLEKSEHIGKILIDPRNSNVVYVAAQGPLWGAGGDRGLYKTTDGGSSWECVLKISENTGVSDIAFDPRNPDVIYAASYQRRRHVWTLVNGGPEAAIHKSTDGGKSWNKLTNGLPGGELGRIGIAVSPVNPDIVYALIEATEDNGGFFRSTDRGASWEKRYNYKNTSAQYYQELFCDPKDPDRVYSMDTYLQVTEDGGKTWKSLGNRYRHVDDHALWIDPDNTNHLIVGGDGGLYQTYDRGSTWDYFENLPVSQFYRIATDNSEPFYYVYGGTQDNSTWGGPSRTINSGGITNEDWFLIVGGDGYQARIDPTNPDIVYGQWQYGNLVRYDRKSGEVFYIQPQPEKGEELRWNWDTPLILSSHSPTRLYIAANRLFRTDDRGNTWKAISPDLSRQIDRNKLPVMGKIQSIDAVAKNASTSIYGNSVALSESPLNPDLLYVGTDDGLIQITEDGGQNWTAIKSINGLPDTTYVSDLFASQHNENVVYASFNNHKRADFKPYLFKSTDKGKSWKSIVGNLPNNHQVWTIVEDFVNPNLLFCGTEFALYFSIDGGEKWTKLSSGFPTIAVRDLEIQKRESDLVVGTFGRGIYILDDYSPLRTLNSDILQKDIFLFPVKDALMFNQDDSKAKSDNGETFYRAKNPEYGATFSFYLKDAFKTLKQSRREQESKLKKEGKPISYPTLEQMFNEDNEEASYLILQITNDEGFVCRQLTHTPTKGINRVNWDLCFPNTSPIEKDIQINRYSGMHVLPGKYFVSILKYENGEITKLTEPQEFLVKPLNNVTLPSKDNKQLVAFRKQLLNLQLSVLSSNSYLEDLKTRIKAIKKAILATVNPQNSLIKKAREIELQLIDIDVILNGNQTIARLNENQPPSLTDRLNYILWGVWSTSQDVTETQKMSFKIANEGIKDIISQLKQITEVDIKSIENELDKMNAPWTPGRLPR
ncbi:MAG TPA: glycosyl hydrolase [Candidatus Kapabacteria bacterium]|nr:glycosyl hydrolase [Candidatus Kapabacteria bacterium]